MGKPPTGKQTQRRCSRFEKVRCIAGSASAATKLTGIDRRLHGHQAEQRIPFRDDGRTGSSAACATQEQNTRATRDTASPTRHCRPYPVPIRSSASLSQLAMQSLRRQNRPSLACSELRVVFGACLGGFVLAPGGCLRGGERRISRDRQAVWAVQQPGGSLWLGTLSWFGPGPLPPLACPAWSSPLDASSPKSLLCSSSLLVRAGLVSAARASRALLAMLLPLGRAGLG